MSTSVSKRIDVYRDEFGVPHVFAESLEEAYYGLGYCAAQDRPQTLALHQLLVQGRLSEHLGRQALPIPSFPLLDHLTETPFFRGYAENSFSLRDTVSIDLWTRHFGYYEAARAGLADLSDRGRSIVEAFVAGVNHYLSQHPPWPDCEKYEAATELAWWTWYEHTIALGFFVSNAFAVAPSKAATNSAWIAGDPHYWFMDGHSEAHISCPALDLSGLWDGHVNLGFWGGTNQKIAVHITAAGLEGATVYRERVNPANREEYFDWRASDFRPVEQTAYDIHVRDAESVRFVSRRTHHGRIIGEDLTEGAPVAYAVRSPVDTDAGERLDQWMGVWTQQSVAEFIAYAQEAPYVRSHRVCIDRDGNIGYVCNGPVAVRNATIDWSTPVDGSVADTEWSEERWRPNAERYGLPSFTNPPCGFIQSANDPPWVATVPAMTSRDFPRYIFPDGWRELGARGARQRQLLHRPRKLTRQDLEAIVVDVFSPKAYYGIRALRRTFEAHRSTLPALSEDAERLDRHLADWDGRADVDAIAMTIAFYLDRTLPDGIPDAIVEETDDPVATNEIREPVELGDGSRYGRALESVAATLTSRYGTVEKKWGEIHAISRPGGDIGIPGGCSSLRGLLGTWHGWWDVDDVLDVDGIERCNFGSRVLRLTELTKDGASVWSLSLTGQGPAAEHTGSPHVRDQAMLYQALTLKRLPLAHDEIRAVVNEDDHASCNHSGHENIVWARTP